MATLFDRIFKEKQQEDALREIVEREERIRRDQEWENDLRRTQELKDEDRRLQAEQEDARRRFEATQQHLIERREELESLRELERRESRERELRIADLDSQLKEDIEKRVERKEFAEIPEGSTPKERFKIGLEWGAQIRGELEAKAELAAFEQGEEAYKEAVEAHRLEGQRREELLDTQIDALDGDRGAIATLRDVPPGDPQVTETLSQINAFHEAASREMELESQVEKNKLELGQQVEKNARHIEQAPNDDLDRYVKKAEQLGVDALPQEWREQGRKEINERHEGHKKMLEQLKKEHLAALQKEASEGFHGGVRGKLKRVQRPKRWEKLHKETLKLENNVKRMERAMKDQMLPERTAKEAALAENAVAEAKAADARLEYMQKIQERAQELKQEQAQKQGLDQQQKQTQSMGL